MATVNMAAVNGTAVMTGTKIFFSHRKYFVQLPLVYFMCVPVQKVRMHTFILSFFSRLPTLLLLVQNEN